MAEQGYGHDSIKQQIAVIADLSRWLKQKNIQVHDLDDMMVDQFLQLRRRQHRIRRGDPKALARLLAMLRQTGVVKQPQTVEDSARSRVIGEFRQYQATWLNYVPVIEQFVSELFTWASTGPAFRCGPKNWPGARANRLTVLRKRGK
jgi:hypothetical protein